MTSETIVPVIGIAAITRPAELRWCIANLTAAIRHSVNFVVLRARIAVLANNLVDNQSDWACGENRRAEIWTALIREEHIKKRKTGLTDVSPVMSFSGCQLRSRRRRHRGVGTRNLNPHYRVKDIELLCNKQRLFCAVRQGLDRTGS